MASLAALQRPKLDYGLPSQLMRPDPALAAFAALGFTFLIDGRFTSGGDPVDLLGGTTVQKGDGSTASTFPTHDGVSGWDFDGGDYFVALGVTPTFTPTTGAFTALVVFTPAVTDSNDALVSSESSVNNGFRLRRRGTDTAYDTALGGVTTSTSTADQTVTVGTKTVAATVVDTGGVRGYTTTDGLSTSVDITGVGTITHAAITIGANAFNAGSAIATNIEAVGLSTNAVTGADLQLLGRFYQA